MMRRQRARERTCGVVLHAHAVVLKDNRRIGRARGAGQRLRGRLRSLLLRLRRLLLRLSLRRSLLLHCWIDLLVRLRA